MVANSLIMNLSNTKIFYYQFLPLVVYIFMLIDSDIQCYEVESHATAM